MRFVDLAHTSRLVSDTSRRNEKIAAWSGFLAGVSTDEIPAAVAFGVGTSSHGRLGVGWATLRDVRPAPAAEASLGIGEVDRVLGGLAGIAGAGSVERRRTVLDELLARATEPEQEMIRAIIRGELRQGALEGVMAAAVAKAAGVPIGLVQRAAMFSGSLATAAQLALAGGAPALEAVELSPSQPIQPMLASPAASVAEALAASGPASVEWKLDGARIQVHRAAGEVSVFTRNLNDITARLGGVVDLVRTLPGGDLVLDGEVLGIDETGAPRRFQDTMGD
ncbi:MAG: ATP-dependent DNA ligase, partial [Ilumatobacteraceae bacterium]